MDAIPKPFQSTPSAWRETLDRWIFWQVCQDFNPLPPHGGRRRKTCYEVFADLRFQSTPSAWRETAFGYGFKIQLFHFNPLPPHGGRLLDQCHAVRIIFISIHSLRMEGDYIDLGYLCGGVYFNPLPPHGGRQDKLPVEANFENISIHSLRMEGDPVILASFGFLKPFQSTPSAWRETKYNNS